jgi:hypothetical protein
MLVNVEQGAVNPSVGTLLRISDALGVGLPDVVELWDWTLGPGDQHVSQAHARGTKELVQVRQGPITVEVAEQSVGLRPATRRHSPAMCRIPMPIRPDVRRGFAWPAPDAYDKFDKRIDGYTKVLLHPNGFAA